MIALLLPGWTIGEGSGVRNTSPPAPAERLWTVIRGGSRSGRVTKCSSFAGWSTGMSSTGGIGARCATVNEKETGARPAIRTTTFTRSP